MLVQKLSTFQTLFAFIGHHTLIHFDPELIDSEKFIG